MRRLLQYGILVSALVVSMSTGAAAGVPCVGTSTIMPGAMNPCIGEIIEVNAQISDCYGTPVQGAVVYFESSREGQDVFYGSPDTTGVLGHAEATMTSAYPGYCSLYADVEWSGYWITIGPSVTFEWSGASDVERLTWGRIKSLYR